MFSKLNQAFSSQVSGRIEVTVPGMPVFAYIFSAFSSCLFYGAAADRAYGADTFCIHLDHKDSGFPCFIWKKLTNSCA